MAGKKKIGATIALDGESQFKSAVTACNKAVNNFRSELNYVKEVTKGNANSLDALQQKHKALSEVLAGQIEKEKAVQKGLDNAREQYNRVGTELENYKKKLEDAKATLKQMKESGTASEEEMQKQRDTVNELSGVVEKGAKTYQAAENRVMDWEKQLNNAKTQTLAASRAVDENAKYMVEAEKSTDKCATSIDAFGKKANDVAKETKNLNDNFTGFEKLELCSQYLDKASDAMKQLGSSAYNAALELDEGYDTIITKTGATGDALDDLNDVADNIFGDLPVEMADVGTAVGEVNTRFGQTGDTLEKTSKQFMEFAEINGTDVNESIDATDRILTQFNVDVSESGDFLGLLTKRGQETGKSVSDLMSELDANAATLKELNLDVVESTNLLALFEANGVDSSTAMKGLKTAVNEYTKEGMSAREGLEATILSIQNAQTSTEALSIAQEVFGTRGAQVMADGIRDGRISLDDLSESMGAYGTTVEDTFNATLDPWDQAKVATNNLKTAGSELTGEFLSAVAPAIETVSGAVKSATQWFRGLPAPVKTVVSVVGAVGVGAGVAAPKVMKLVTTIKTLQTANAATKALKTMNDAQKTAATVAGVATTAEELSTAAKTKGATATGASAVAAGTDAVAKGTEAAATGTATVAQTGLNVAMNACPVLLLVAGIAALVGAVAAYATGAEEATTETDKLRESARTSIDALSESQEALSTSMQTAQDSVENAAASSQMADGIVEELEGLANQTSLTADEQSRMAVLVAELNTLFPDMGLEIDEVTGKLNMTNSELRNYVDNIQDAAMAQAYRDAFKDAFEAVAQAQRELIDAQLAQEDVQDRLKTLNSQYNTVLRKQTQATKDNGDGVIWWNGTYRDSQQVLAELGQEIYDLEGDNKDLTAEIEEQKQAVEDNTEVADTYMEKANELNTTLEDGTGVTQENTEATQGQTEALNGMADAAQNASTIEQARAIATQEASQASISVVGQELEAFNNLDTATQEKAVSVANSIATMQENVTGALQSQMDMFEHYGEVTTIETGTMLENMQSQVDGVKAWEENLVTLSKSGIDEGLLQHLAELGPEGAGYVQSFVNMSADELSQANSLWQESVDMKGMTNDLGEQLTQGIGELSAGGTEAWNELAQSMYMQADESGQYSAQGFVDGLAAAKEQLEAAGEEAGDSVLNSLNDSIGVASPSWKTRESGLYMDIGLANGISGVVGKNTVTKAAKEVGESVPKTIETSLDIDTITTYGENASKGLAQGIRDGKSEVINAAREVAEAASDTAKGTLEIGSPSKVFTRYGEYTDAGYIRGIENKKKDVQRSVAGLLSFSAVSPNSTVDAGSYTAADYNLLVSAFSQALVNLNLTMKVNQRDFGRVVAECGGA